MSVTSTLTIRFERPVPVGRELQARGWVDKQEPRQWHIAGELVLASSGATLARANGIFVLRDAQTHFGSFEQWLADQ